MKHSLVLALCLMGCTGRASLGDQGTVSDKLTTPPAAEDAGVADTSDASPADPGAAPAISPTDIEYISLDEGFVAFPAMRVDDQCHVTDARGLDAPGDPSFCDDLFNDAVDPTLSSSCGPQCAGIDIPCLASVRMHLHDGREFVRDLNAGLCTIALPGVRATKALVAVWYSAGGH